MRAFVIEARDEGVEVSLLRQHVGGGGLRRLSPQAFEADPVG